MEWYKLSRQWFDWCFENPDKIKPVHSAMYFFIIEHCNRLWWKEKFWLPMEMTKDAIGISNYRTYSNTLSDLIEWWFIKEIQKSKNQYSSTIIAIVENTEANTKALDKALQKHSQKQSISTVYGTVCIDKQETIEQETINHVSENTEDKEIQKPKKKKINDYSSLENDPEDSFAKEAYLTLKKMWWNESIPLQEFIEYIDAFLVSKDISKQKWDFIKWQLWLKDFLIYWSNDKSTKKQNYLLKMRNSPSFNFNQKQYAKR